MLNQKAFLSYWKTLFQCCWVLRHPNITMARIHGSSLIAQVWFPLVQIYTSITLDKHQVTKNWNLIQEPHKQLNSPKTFVQCSPISIPINNGDSSFKFCQSTCKFLNRKVVPENVVPSPVSDLLALESGSLNFRVWNSPSNALQLSVKCVVICQIYNFGLSKVVCVVAIRTFSQVWPRNRYFLIITIIHKWQPKMTTDGHRA